jgi:hypothetical protein
MTLTLTPLTPGGLSIAASMPAAGLSWLNSVLVHQAGHDSADIAIGSTVARIDARGNVLLGPNNLVTDTEANIHGAGMVADFLYQQQTRRIFTRSLVLAELGDPPDLVISRAGPNNTYPDNGGLGVAGVLMSDSLGSIRFQGTYTPAGGTPGVTLGGSFQGDSAQIYARASEDNVYTGSAYHQGGELYFATTPNGTSVSVDALILKQNGDVWIPGGTIRFLSSVPQLLANSASSSSHAFMDLRLNGDPQSRFVQRQSGAMEWGNGTAATDVTLSRTAVAQMQGAGNWKFLDGVATKTKAGTPVDGDFTTTPPDGTIVGDSSGSKFWIRLGGTWKGVAVA